MQSTSRTRSLPFLATAALLAACAGGAEPLAPSLNVTSTLAGEGQLVICKAGNAAGSFDFTWSIDYLSGGNISSGQVTVPVGSCVVAYTIPSGGPSGTAGWAQATVTEAAPPVNWSLTSTGVTFSTSPVPNGWPTPATNLATRTVSSVGMVHDLGAEVTFTNTYTPPPPPPTGCTYTQGYWKTHSEFGPAPYNNTWAQLANGASTTFYLSGASWLSVFNTSPRGNAYYNLAHQFMAARLSILAGSDPAVVASAIASATTLFNTYTPAQIGALKGSNALRAQFVSLAETLDNYNNGLIGPGHCN